MANMNVPGVENVFDPGVHVHVQGPQTPTLTSPCCDGWHVCVPAVQPAPIATPTAPAAAPVAPAAPTPGASFGYFIVDLLEWAILIGIIAGLYLWFKRSGHTVDSLLKKMGVQPDTVGAGGAPMAAHGGAAVAPGPPPPPPPVVADPNLCQFCGQMKDAAGNCACTVTKGPGGAVPPFGGGGFGAPAGSGPRLVGMQGTYMGSVFPLHGSATIGREASNPIPLDRDTTSSRRHAQITDQGGVFMLQDLGSANGTFVNGARITECPLSPGDEIAIGGTRFRFEV